MTQYSLWMNFLKWKMVLLPLIHTHNSTSPMTFLVARMNSMLMSKATRVNKNNPSPLPTNVTRGGFQWQHPVSHRSCRHTKLPSRPCQLPIHPGLVTLPQVTTRQYPFSFNSLWWEDVNHHRKLDELTIQSSQVYPLGYGRKWFEI